MKTCCLFMLVLLSAVCVKAKQLPFVFRHIGIVNGLPDNYVKSIFRIPDGRMGIRTTVLLSLYDSSGFSNFPYNNSNNYTIDYDHSIPRQYVDVSNRVWMKERGVLRVFDLYTERYISNVDSLLYGFGLKEKICDLFIDSEQRYWFVTSGQSVYLYDPFDEKMEMVCRADEFIRHNGTLREVVSNGDLCWMVHRKGMIRCYDRKQKRFIRQENFLAGKLKIKDQVVSEMLDNGDFWLMWDRGVGYYVAHSNEWIEFLDIQQSDYEILTSMTADEDGNAWVGSVADGIYFINRVSHSITCIGSISLITGDTIRNDNIHSILFDKQSGGLWIGFFNQGICFYHPAMNSFPIYNRNNVSGVWKDKTVKTMLEMDDGNILMGTSKGLYRYHPKTGVMDMPYKELDNQNCKKIYRDSRGRIWLGTFRDGLYSIVDGKVRNYSYPDMNYQKDPDYNNIRTIIEDRKGRLWVSIYGGVGLFNPANGKIDLLLDKYPQLKQYKVSNTLEIDDEGRLIVGADNGLYIYNPDNGSLYIPELDDPDNILYTHESNKYNCILNDSRGELWFGTQYGLYVVTGNHQIYYIGKEQGLFNATIQSIQEDNNGDIWFSTINSLYKVKVEKTESGYHFSVISFTPEVGLQRDNLYEFSSLKTKNGMLYFGLVNGFNAFTPENILYSQSDNCALITSFRLFNVPVLPGKEYGGRVLFDRAIGYVDKIVLNHDENFITLNFSGLNFVNPSQTFFRYYLEGFDKEWIELQSENGQWRATYNNLPPGQYTFRVMTAGNDKVWGKETHLSLVIRPPFWDTMVARIVYLVLVCLAIGVFIAFMNRRNYMKIIRIQKKEEAKQKEELDQMKFRFFTNISHELRTPLTLIITPLDILKRKMTDESTKRQLDNIYQNAQELLMLVNQLLDFRKLEMKGEKLYLKKENIKEVIEFVYNSFIPMAAEKHFEYTCRTLPHAIYMYFDHGKVNKIINNLLSNAFKFTPEGGRISLSLEMAQREERTYVKIKVSDTGIGIPEVDLSHIFERFYQVQGQKNDKLGSGIGLHLIKEYVYLHEGDITVESSSGQGTVFTVWLPIDLKLQDEPCLEEYIKEHAEESGDEKIYVVTDDRKKLLIVEDNQEFRSFLKEQLEEAYLVIEAADGEEGEKIAIEENPDLIVSDIMMPKVDGIELCRRIKTNVQTSHIPVILLTARTADDVKISSYEVGADSYISKPFNFDILMVRVEKLIEQQEKRRKEFNRSLEVVPSLITITSVDEQLMQKVLECIDKNMDNAGYTVDELSSDLRITRVHLYRKLHAITGNSPSNFIKNIRLKRAARLLESTQLSVVEVADRVGFSSASYFINCFKEEFGQTPIQYVENCKKTDT